MKIIGLCGGSGSGKGAVSDIFSIFGIPSVDTDSVYRKMTEGPSPCLEAIISEFGEEIIDHLGALDRKKLRKIVFESERSEEKRSLLNKITHKFILDKTREILLNYKKEGKAAAIVDAPLLFESGFDKECDIILSVCAQKEQRLIRIMKRDGLSVDDAVKRINSQISDEELIKLSDYTIINNGDLSDLYSRVKEIAEEILMK